MRRLVMAEVSVVGSIVGCVWGDGGRLAGGEIAWVCREDGIFAGMWEGSGVGWRVVVLELVKIDGDGA